ncbi:MAG: hypothetical protein ACJAT2_002351 [Bacteriovoracaceae bacterium]|jgi:hypothetical protein
MFIILIVSSVFLVFGLLLGLNYFYFKGNARTLPGRIHAIERYQSRTNRRTSTFYRPLIQYAFNGENYVFTSSFGTGDNRWKIGQRVEVYSLDNGPEYVRLKAKIHFYFPLIFFIFGLCGSAYYFYHHHSFIILSVYALGMMLVPFGFYHFLKSKNLVEEFIESLLKNKIEDEESLKGREIFFEKALLEKHTQKNDKAAFIVTLVFAIAISTGLHFSWEKTKDTSKEFIYGLTSDFNSIQEIKNYMNDKNLVLSMILAFFSAMLIYSLIYQVLRKK